MVPAPPPAPASMPLAARPSAIWALAREPRIAPSTETPVAPPSERKKVISALAAPMSSSGTEFCTTSTRFCMTMPTPRPTRLMKAPSSIRLVCSSSMPISARPTVSRVAPVTMNFL